jgi:hypothetical protein
VLSFSSPTFDGWTPNGALIVWRNDDARTNAATKPDLVHPTARDTKRENEQ